MWIFHFFLFGKQMIFLDFLFFWQMLVITREQTREQRRTDIQWNGWAKFSFCFLQKTKKKTTTASVCCFAPCLLRFPRARSRLLQQLLIRWIHNKSTAKRQHLSSVVVLKIALGGHPQCERELQICYALFSFNVTLWQRVVVLTTMCDNICLYI